MRKLPVVVFLVCAVVGPWLTCAAPNVHAGGKEAPALELRLELSVKELDAAKPAGSFKCIAHNKTAAAVDVPALGDRALGFELYGQGKKQFFASTLHVLDAKDVPKPMRIEPGKEAVLFELPLDGLFRDVGKKPKYGWSWIARPEPPISPIHIYRGKGFEESASFWVSLRQGKMRVTSPRVELRITVRPD